MQNQYQIAHSTLADIPTILELYRQAMAYQIAKFPGNVWPVFPSELVEAEIQEGRQFKLLVNNQIACVWAITFNDPYIWEEKDVDPAIYIHRIAKETNAKNHQFVQLIVDWAKPFAEANQKKYIRLDTCGNNEKLIKHYTDCGFEFLGINKLKDASNLAKHYHDADVCFFELKL